MPAKKKAVKDNRPDWDTYYMDIAHVVAKRGNCCRRQVAAVLVNENRIVSTGYNGTPRGVKNCFEGGCPRCAGKSPSGSKLDECLCSHAEENAIAQAAYHGISVRGSTLYVTIKPCLTCARLAVSAGVVEVVYEHDYSVESGGAKLFRKAGVKCRRFKRSKTN